VANALGISFILGWCIFDICIVEDGKYLPLSFRKFFSSLFR